MSPAKNPMILETCARHVNCAAAQRLKFLALNRNKIASRTFHQSPSQALQDKVPGGYRALTLMEQHLATRSFFVGERYSIADIALYAYTHVAHEGGFDLAACPAVRRWLARVAAQPGYRGMDDAR